MDKDDCSVSRSDALFKQLFKDAQVQLLLEQTQQEWLDELLNVKMYILQ